MKAANPWEVDIASGRVAGAHFIPSPNFDDRPLGMTPEVLIIHSISLPPGEFGGPGIEQLFCNRLDPDEHPYYREIEHLEVSAHLLVRRDGRVIQFVSLNHRAWHAGFSRCEGRERTNDFSIGIELEGTDEAPFESVQYHRLAGLTCGIMLAYPAITLDRIYGHCDVAPGRKTDPGPCFDWAGYRKLLIKTV